VRELTGLSLIFIPFSACKPFCISPDAPESESLACIMRVRRLACEIRVRTDTSGGCPQGYRKGFGQVDNPQGFGT